MTNEVKEILTMLTNAENAETIAKLAEEYNKIEDALREKDKEVIKTKEKMIEYALNAHGKGDKEEDVPDRDEETIEDVFARWEKDPEGEMKRARKE